MCQADALVGPSGEMGLSVCVEVEGEGANDCLPATQLENCNHQACLGGARLDGLDGCRWVPGGSSPVADTCTFADEVPDCNHMGCIAGIGPLGVLGPLDGCGWVNGGSSPVNDVCTVLDQVPDCNHRDCLPNILDAGLTNVCDWATGGSSPSDDVCNPLNHFLLGQDECNALNCIVYTPAGGNCDWRAGIGAPNECNTPAGPDPACTALCSECAINNVTCPTTPQYYGTSFIINYSHNTSNEATPFDIRTLRVGGVRQNCVYDENAPELCMPKYDDFTAECPAGAGNFDYWVGPTRYRAANLTYSVSCYSSTTVAESNCDSTDSIQFCNVTCLYNVCDELPLYFNVTGFPDNLEFGCDLNLSYNISTALGEVMCDIFPAPSEPVSGCDIRGVDADPDNGEMRGCPDSDTGWSCVANTDLSHYTLHDLPAGNWYLWNVCCEATGFKACGEDPWWFKAVCQP